MKRFVLLIFVFANCMIVNAETSCHASGNYPNAIAGMSLNPVYYRVRVFFHIVRDGNGGGYYQFPSTDIPSCIQTLNTDFGFPTMHYIYFDYAGMDYINHTDIYNLTSYDSFESNLMFTMNRHSDAIDVYLLPTESSIAGYANGIPGNALAIGGSLYGMILGSSSLLSHEMGHCLGLFHTFHGSSDEPYGCPEMVLYNRNCGDYVEDTEADPIKLYDHLVACAWYNTTLTDSYGYLYHPDERQIMADVPAECMSNLTNGQGNRVRIHIANQLTLQDRTIRNIAYVQNRQYAGNGEEILMATDSIIAGYNVTSGTNGNVVIPSGGDVTYQAEEKVLLKPGFKVNMGAKFLAKVNALPAPNYNNMPAKHTDASDNYIPFLENTSWTTIYHNTSDTHVWAHVSKCVGDTTMMEKNYKIIKNYQLYMDNPSLYTNYDSIFIREDVENKRVYIYSDFYKRDILWYDFSLQVGDRFPRDRTAPEYLSDFIITDISTIENSGYSRKRYTFVNESDSIVWIEGIGNYNCFFSPQFIKRDEMRVICVHKGDETVYDTGSFLERTCGDVDQTLADLLSPESIPAIPTTPPSATKILRDGQILILRGDRTYTLTGLEVK